MNSQNPLEYFLLLWAKLRKVGTKIADIVLLSHNRLQLTVKTSYLETNLHSAAFIICCLYFSLDLHFSKVFELAFVFSLVFALVFVFILGSLYVLVFVFLVGLCIGVCISRGSLYWCLYQLSLQQARCVFSDGFQLTIKTSHLEIADSPLNKLASNRFV